MAKQPGKASFSDGYQFVFCLVGGVLAIYLIYEYMLKETLHPLLFYWRFVTLSPFYIVSLLFPHFANTATFTMETFFSQAHSIASFISMPDWGREIFLAFSPVFYDAFWKDASVSGSFSFEEMFEVSSFYARYASVLVIFPILYYISKIRHIKTYQTLHNQTSLLKVNQKVFPAVAPIVNRDLTKESLNTGPWRLPDSPLTWAMQNKLLIEEPENYDLKNGEVLKPEQIQFFSFTNVFLGVPNDVNSKEFKNACLSPSASSKYLRKNNLFRADLAASLFIRQLGNKIMNNSFITMLKRKSFDECGNYWRAVFAGVLYRFGENSTGKFKFAYPTLDKFAKTFAGKESFNPELFTFCTEQLVDDLWAGYENNYQFCNFYVPYATFENSFFMHLTYWAKTNGKIAPSDFIWLRPIDRTLYFSIDQVNARVGHVEALGPWSQFAGEAYCKMGIHYPYIKDAVEGLYNTLAMEGWVPSKSLNYTQGSLLEEWSRASFYDMKVSKKENQEISSGEIFSEFIERLRRIPKWETVWKMCPPLPQFLMSETQDFFTTEEKEIFQKNVAPSTYLLNKKKQEDFAKTILSNNELRCPVCTEPFSDTEDETGSIRFIPEFQLEISKEGNGLWKFKDTTMLCNSCVPKRLAYMSETGTVNYVQNIDHLEAIYHVDRHDAIEALAIIRSISDLYTTISWTYDEKSSLVADMSNHVTKIRKKLS